jgi:glycosyltransferase involved in cell wall biosynthesis
MNTLIISYNNFPEGDAGSLRQYTFGKLLSHMGHTVFVIGMGNITCYEISDYRGVKYTSLRINQNKSYFISRLENYFGYKLRLKRFLKQYCLHNKIECLLVVDIPLNALLFIKRLARKNNIMLIHDSVEWYSPEQFKLRKFALPYILKDLYNRFFIDKDFKVIAISKYLEKHYIERGIETARIPVILDIDSISCEKRTCDGKLTILYAGSPGKKDYLKEVIEGIALLNKNIIDIIDLRVIGINKNQLIDMCGVSQQALDKLGNSLNAVGRVPRESVLKNLEEADFTVLMRSPDKRYAKAGFPTKVVESLASGTPVICNITSDLGDYIRDGENGIVVKECSAEALLIAVKSALDLTFEQRKIMYKNARKCAEECFDYRLYTNSIRELSNQR